MFNDQNRDTTKIRFYDYKLESISRNISFHINELNASLTIDYDNSRETFENAKLIRDNASYSNSITYKTLENDKLGSTVTGYKIPTEDLEFTINIYDCSDVEKITRIVQDLNLILDEQVVMMEKDTQDFKLWRTITNNNQVSKNYTQTNYKDVYIKEISFNELEQDTIYQLKIVLYNPLQTWKNDKVVSTLTGTSQLVERGIFDLQQKSSYYLLSNGNGLYASLDVSNQLTPKMTIYRDVVANDTGTPQADFDAQELIDTTNGEKKLVIKDVEVDLSSSGGVFWYQMLDDREKTVTYYDENENKTYILVPYALTSQLQYRKVVIDWSTKTAVATQNSYLSSINASEFRLIKDTFKDKRFKQYIIGDDVYIVSEESGSQRSYSGVKVAGVRINYKTNTLLQVLNWQNTKLSNGTELQLIDMTWHENDIYCLIWQQSSMLKLQKYTNKFSEQNTTITPDLENNVSHAGTSYFSKNGGLLQYAKYSNDLIMFIDNDFRRFNLSLQQTQTLTANSHPFENRSLSNKYYPLFEEEKMQNQNVVIYLSPDNYHDMKIINGTDVKTLTLKTGNLDFAPEQMWTNAGGLKPLYNTTFKQSNDVPSLIDSDSSLNVITSRSMVKADLVNDASLLHSKNITNYGVTNLDCKIEIKSVTNDLGQTDSYIEFQTNVEDIKIQFKNDFITDFRVGTITKATLILENDHFEFLDQNNNTISKYIDFTTFDIPVVEPKGSLTLTVKNLGVDFDYTEKYIA